MLGMTMINPKMSVAIPIQIAATNARTIFMTMAEDADRREVGMVDCILKFGTARTEPLDKHRHQRTQGTLDTDVGAISGLGFRLQVLLEGNPVQVGDQILHSSSYCAGVFLQG